MAKAYSKAAKRAAKKAKQGLPELAATPKRDPNGCFSKRQRQQSDKNPDKVALQARARQVGAENESEMRSQMLGEAAGQALHLSLDPDPAKRLWDHYTALTAAEVSYHRSLGLSIHPKTAKIEAMREVFEVRDDISPDLRTAEERDRAARRAWDYWREKIEQTGLNHGAAIYAARHDFCVLVRDTKVTAAGKRFVAAMQAIDALM